MSGRNENMAPACDLTISCHIQYQVRVGTIDKIFFTLAVPAYSWIVALIIFHVLNNLEMKVGRPVAILFFISKMAYHITPVDILVFCNF